MLKPSMKSVHNLPNEQTIRNCLSLNTESMISMQVQEQLGKALLQNDFSEVRNLLHPLHSDSFNVCITHDIDWLYPHHVYSIAKYARSLFSKQQWLNASQLLQSDLFLENIQKLLELEKELGINAVYCVGASSSSSLKRYDIRYTVNDKHFHQLLMLLKKYNSIIGLHSSYHADSTHQILREKLLLEEHIQQSVTLHRSHFLHYQPSSLYPQLAAANILYDLSMGKTHEVGFRNGLPAQYKPLDWVSGNTIQTTIIPLMLLDNIFFVKPYHEVMTSFRKAISELKTFGGSACILFHPENMLLKPQLWNYFEEIIHICREEGATMNPPLQP